MVEAANAVQAYLPVNGLSALDGHPAPLRYFYFWYVVCADLARLLHLPARASLAASCVWAVLGIFSLCSSSRSNTCLGSELGPSQDAVCWSLAVFGIMGLDVHAYACSAHQPERFIRISEIEWWHQDRTPSLTGSSGINSPHHLAAFACLLHDRATWFLHSTLRDNASSTRERQRNSDRRLLLASIFAGTVLSLRQLDASVLANGCCGQSLVIVWGSRPDTWQRQFRTRCRHSAGSGIVALVACTMAFYTSLQTTDGSEAVSANFISIRWRNYRLCSHFYQTKYHLVTSAIALMNSDVIAQAGVLTINFFDLGFFFFVLIHRIRHDANRRLTALERALWAFVMGTAIPYFFLSSASIASPNDLGVDSGLLLRVLLQLWAVPLVYQVWRERRRSATRSRHGWAFTLAAATLFVGLAGEIFQVAWERIYFPLVGSQTLAKQLDILTTDHLAQRLFNIREAYRAVDRTNDSPPASASVQYNPISPMQPALTFYSTHQIAAFDPGCGTGYGGDYTACLAVMPRLLALYGNTKGGIERARAGNDRQDGAASWGDTAEDAQAMCRELHLTFLIAESLDSVWLKPTSWVWTLDPLAANETVRVFRCPTT